MKKLGPNKKLSLEFIGFLQALGLTVYCALVGTILFKSSLWMGAKPGILGPALFLTLFVTSIIICALISLAQPFIIFWEEKNTQKALKLVFFTGLWLLILVATIFISVFFL